MKERDYNSLEKMISYCEDVALLYNKYNRDFELYLTDISFQYSANMCIIQIGELVSRLSDEIMEEYNNIPWHSVKSMRNLHAHDYEKVDMKITWQIITEDIPQFKMEIQEILEKEMDNIEYEDEEMSSPMKM